MRPSGTVAARSAHFENLTANAHVYRGASRYDRSWSRLVRKRALYEIRNQIAWLLQHGQKGLTTDELDDGNFMCPPVSAQDGPIVPPPLMPTPRTSNECESRLSAPCGLALGVAGTVQLTDAPPRAETASAASSSTSAKPPELRTVPVLADVATARTPVKKRRRHEDADEDDADDSPVPCKRRRTRRTVAFRRR
ncbi:hypothetical protein GGF32_010068 [Allomyces javanicus]|nr:hypothetical protein GGF32_010068 [Allomyces javanicus]